MKRLMAFAVLLMSLAGCGGSDDNETQMTVKVAAHQGSCNFGFNTLMCHLIQHEGSQTWDGMWPYISGFTYVWGHEYVLVVGETIGEKTVEGRIITRRLIAVKSDQIVDPDTEFQYYSDPADIKLTSSTGGTLVNDTPFVCLDDARCEALATLLAASGGIRMTFGYSTGTSLPLVLKSSTRT